MVKYFPPQYLFFRHKLPLLDRPGVLINSLWFNVFWLSAVLGQNSWIAVPITLLVIHGYWTKNDLSEWCFIASVAVLGAAVDSLLSVAGVFVFASGLLAPIWLVLLWAGFAATVRHSLFWLKRSSILCAAFGAFGGTTSYLAGARLGAVDFGYSEVATLFILMGVWAIVLPLVFRWSAWLSQRMNPVGNCEGDTRGLPSSTTSMLTVER